MAFRNRRAANLPAKLSRSWLLVNAAKPEAFGPALASEADSVIFDMEAAVPDDKKDAARDAVVEALSTGMTAWVRVNGIDTDFWAKDLAELSKAPGLRGVMLAMTEEPVQVTYTAMRLKAGTPVLALVESALGIENATAIASAPVPSAWLSGSTTSARTPAFPMTRWPWPMPAASLLSPRAWASCPAPSTDLRRPVPMPPRSLPTPRSPHPWA